jgi:DtxR family Mn-dependent transcriptional regulator
MSDAVESSQDYLERILMLRIKNGNVRSIDIAESMGFSKPSVSIAMKKLREKGLAEMDEKTGYIRLTEQGEKIAEATYERHVLLTDTFERLGVNPKTAEEDACKVEHDLSEETWNAIKKHVQSKKEG